MTSCPRLNSCSRILSHVEVEEVVINYVVGNTQLS
jgi:hypothetical protein